MKIRNDFVSNSSSSSFVLFGTEVSKEELVGVWRSMPGHENDKDDNVDTYEVNELLKKRFVSEYDIEWGCAYCGLSPELMKNDQTLLNFKEQIVSELKAAGIERTIDDIKFYSGTNDDGYVSIN